MQWPASNSMMLSRGKIPVTVLWDLGLLYMPNMKRSLGLRLRGQLGRACQALISPRSDCPSGQSVKSEMCCQELWLLYAHERIL